MQVSNGDVTGSAPLAEIWQHDFWYIWYPADSILTNTNAEHSAGLFRGQQIRSDQSHKSYRPVTILSLRLVNWAGKLLPNGKSQTIHLSVSQVATCCHCLNELSAMSFIALLAQGSIGIALRSMTTQEV